jgi:hypothetical protein
MGGPEMAPHTPHPSERPGEPVALLFVGASHPSKRALMRSAVARHGIAEARRRSAIRW